MRKLLAAIGDALRTAFSTLKLVAKITHRGLEWVWEHVPVLGFGGGGGGGSCEPDERDVAQQAAQQAQAQQRQADGRAEIDAMAQAVFRIARALRDGKEPEAQDAAALAPAHVKYLLGLSRSELEIVAQSSMDGIRSRRAFVDRVVAPEGCPSIEQVAQALENKSVAKNERRFRTLADKLRARKLRTTDPAEQNAAVGALVRKYSQAA